MLIHRFQTLELLVLLPLISGRMQGAPPTFTTTNNWGGYAVTGGNNSVTMVAGSWKVPKSQCNGTIVSGTAIFVGIDGYPPSSPNVEQVGTAAYCVNGTLGYYAFYEFACPAGPPTCPGPTPPGQYPVKPGDAISAVVTCNGGTQFTVTLMDGATTLFTATQPSGFGTAACSSAEWVVDDPVGPKSLYPLTSFEQIQFVTDSATIGGQTGPISSFANNTAITMTSDGTPTGVVEVVPSKLSGGGSSFVASTQAQSFGMSVNCTSSGQVCLPDYSASLTVSHSGPLTIMITAATSHCSNVRNVVSLDGSTVAKTPFLGPGGTSGPFSTASVSAGTHTIAVQGIGEVGGCNSGSLISWGGTLIVAEK